MVDAVDKGVYVPTIDESVFLRSFSGKRLLREQGSVKLTATVNSAKAAGGRGKAPGRIAGGDYLRLCPGH